MLKLKIVLLVILLPLLGISQVHTEKKINQQQQTWVSLNNTIMFDKHWGLLADFHVRRTDFLDSESFYMARGAAAYVTENKQIIALGCGHFWFAPSNPNWNTFSNQDFIYQLYQFNSKIGKASVLHRFRNEQRWQQIIVNDINTGNKQFTDRVRYLISFDIPIFKNKSLPRLAISDEILVQFGKEVVYNTLDQNRFFIGIKQSINPKLSFDFGYMNVYQQKKSGYQYDMNHTLRLFFYYKNDANSITHFGHHSQ
ncbi:MAG: DUF2490 domain-containing protein [Flavobacterium sp.]|uniref:DUF2490 domain-containing protein n=1 Tax=Flavobacterium sp. TaxID=239 RepID=UPI0026281373|nr:DUF2490 domain-containing protein [Flavobacterium sp.]MDD5151002.1 DUF2490 domain-containing protein [Flavobacterium sp.]